MDYKLVFELFGGLGLFIYGMNIMSDGLEKAAGAKLKKIVELLTRNRLIAVVVGAFVTMIVQSSSATTVMVVGFVNAGIMNLAQSIGIIMGANIGTTITAQIASLKLSEIAPIAIALGVIIKYFSKNKTMQKYGEIMLGFGLLFLGMDVMKDAVKPLRDYEGFTNLLTQFGSGSALDTLLAILVGFGVTAVIQSSSATTGILIALAQAGLLTIDAAFPVLLGTNIGTTVTAMLSSLKATKNAKRAAIMHLLFNVIGTALFAVLLGRLALPLVKSMGDDPARQLANMHTLFNIATTLLLLPFAGLIVKAAMLILPVSEDELVLDEDASSLDDRILETPVIALSQVEKEVVKMGELALQSYKYAMNTAINVEDDSYMTTFEIERRVNKLEKTIAEFLVKLSNTELGDNERAKVDGLFNTINDIERIGDHADNLAELGLYKIENELIFSVEAVEELRNMSERVEKSYTQAIEALRTGDDSYARAVIEREGEIDELEKQYRKAHIKRLNKGLCAPSTGVVFLDCISNLERIGDHSMNIALSILDAGKE